MMPSLHSGPDPGSPVAQLQKAAKRARDEGDLAQAEKFEQAARDLGADGDAMTAVLAKLAKATTGVGLGRIPKVKRPEMVHDEQRAPHHEPAEADHGAAKHK